MLEKVFEKMPAWMKKPWALFALSCGAGLLLFSLIYFAFLRAPIGGALARQGQSALAAQNYDSAANKFATSLRMKRGTEETYAGYAEALIGLQQFEKAHAVLDQAIGRISGAESLYLWKARAYSAAGSLGDAADYLDHIPDSYVNKGVQAARPGDIRSTPAQGSYSTAQKVTLTAGAGQKIYYTLNGTTPTFSSQVYTAPVTVSKSCVLSAIAVDGTGLVSPRLRLAFTINNADETIYFTDNKMEKMVRNALNLTDETIRAAQLANVTELTNADLKGNLHTLADLEYLPNLKKLVIDHELLIGDFAPIGACSHLEELSMADCAVSDTDLSAIAACAQLTALNLDGNGISNLLTLKTLKYLETLSAADNEIASAAAVREFPLLSSLNLRGNRLCDVNGLEDAKELVTLDLSENYITDPSALGACEKLTELRLAENTALDLKKCAKIASLKMLDVSHCGVNDLTPLNGLTGLQVLVAADNVLHSLNGWKQPLTELDVSANPIEDLTPLQGQNKLRILRIAETSVEDIACLSGMPAMEIIDLFDSDVKDISILSTCPKLRQVRCNPGTRANGISAKVEIVSQ